MISAYLLPLSKYGNRGKVHSVFKRSFNIQVGEQLINLTSYPDYFSSYGVYVPEQQFDAMMPYVQQGNLLKVNDQAIVFYSTEGVHTLNLADMETIDLNVQSLKLNITQLRTLKETLEQFSIDEMIGLPLDNQAKTVIQQLKNFRNMQQENWEEIVKYLVGRGYGLTPSGDDVLVAFLAVLHAAEDERVEVLTSTLLRTRYSTTDISKAYIEASIEGFVNSHVYQLLTDLKNGKEAKLYNDVERLLQIGHFSGKDLAYGMLLALQNINEKEKG